jgi:transitional endoplasmic reticulum ATPase
MIGVGHRTVQLRLGPNSTLMSSGLLIDDDDGIAVLQLLGTASSESASLGPDFDPDLVSCRADLQSLVDRLAAPGVPQNWSLCIHGPPGTGKTQFARYLAQRLGKEVTQKRASDLLSPLVGLTERRIAQAFAAARAERTMLLVDEADSLLHDRRYALQSWEVTQVNEMLAWMEVHPLPFVCTTNLMDRLEPATLRRFTFKLQFDPMSSAQAGRAFARFFGCAAQSALPEGLSLGDFATVRRKADLLGPVAAARLVDWLEEEATAKGAKPLGFVKA